MDVLFVCPHHGFAIETGNEDGCPHCLNAALNGPHPLAMTPDERIAEIERMVEPVTCRVSAIMGRISELVGRPVFEIELVTRWDALLDEVRNRTGDVPMDDIIGSIEARGVDVVIVESGDGPDGQR